MRWLIAIMYSLALGWLILSVATFLYNWSQLKRYEERIGRLRMEITVWKTDVRLLTEGIKRETKGRTSPDKHHPER
ncbi:MAG: hypothetical protein GXO39_00840 [Thermotogae bacterium]|nr:hypothetical protein [Thermotogota bacterium]